MKAGGAKALAIFLSVLFTSCGSVGPTVTLTGEKAKIRFHGGREQLVELLAVQDSTILVLAPVDPVSEGSSASVVEVKEIPVDVVALIKVSGFRNDRWWGGVIASQVLPAIGLGVAASSVGADAGAVFGIFMIPPVLTTLMYAATGVPRPTFEDPISTMDMHELCKYARFGGTLTPAQKEQLLRVYRKGPFR